MTTGEFDLLISEILKIAMTSQLYIYHLAGQSLLEEPIVSAEMAMGKVLGATEVEWRMRRTRKMVFEANFPAEAQPRPHIQPWWGWQGEAG